MFRLAEIREEVAAVVGAALPDSVVYGWTPDSVVTPAVIVDAASPFADYQRAMGDGLATQFRFEVVVLTGGIAEQAAQERLDEWASPDGPLVAALYAADLPDAEITSVSGQQYGRLQIAGVPYLGFSLLVEIEA